MGLPEAKFLGKVFAILRTSSLSRWPSEISSLFQLLARLSYVPGIVVEIMNKVFLTANVDPAGPFL